MDKSYVTRIDYAGPHTIVSTTGYSVNISSNIPVKNVSEIIKTMEQSCLTEDKSEKLVMVHIPTFVNA